MSPKEARRLDVIERAVKGQITVAQAARLLSLSERQVKRLKGEYKKIGPAALAHKNRGRKPKHAIPEQLRQQIIALATNEFRGASHSHMAQLLAQYKGVSISAKTITRILKTSGIANPFSHRAPRRRRSRDRMPAEGMLVQGDASPFAWFEDRGPEASLHGFIDDATGKILALYFRPTEDLNGYMNALRMMILTHGVPQAIYTDQAALFFSPEKPTIDDELAGRPVRLTQFGQALSDLGIQHIRARSPQAKGRIERLWKTLQARLVIELRLAGISNIDEANAFLPSFIERFNKQFAVPPAVTDPAFRPAPSPEALDLAISLKAIRTASHGSTISFGGQTYQLTDRRGAVLPLRPGAKVQVLTHLDGSLSALFNARVYALKPCAKPAAQSPAQRDIPTKERAPSKPAPDHPWRRGNTRPQSQLSPAEDYFRQKTLRRSTRFAAG